MEPTTATQTTDGKDQLRILFQLTLDIEVRARGLTPKEAAVCSLICDGLQDREIAAFTGNTVKTLKHHSHAIYEKFNVRSRAQLFAKLIGRR